MQWQWSVSNFLQLKNTRKGYVLSHHHKTGLQTVDTIYKTLLNFLNQFSTPKLCNSRVFASIVVSSTNGCPMEHPEHPSGHRWSSKFISCHQLSSVVISGHQWSSMVISGHQWSSVVISGHKWSSLVIIGHHWSSLVINGHKWSSMVINGHHWSSMVINGHQWSSIVLTRFSLVLCH